VTNRFQRGTRGQTSCSKMTQGVLKKASKHNPLAHKANADGLSEGRNKNSDEGRKGRIEEEDTNE